METRNIACLPFSFQVKHEGKLIPHVTLCPEFLTKSPHFNVERANKLFRGQFSNIIKLMLSIRQIMVMSSDLVKQDISLWSLAELVDVWHKCHRMILEEETRVNDLLGFLKINVNLNIAWLNELFNYKTIIDNYLLEKFEVYLDQVSKLNRYPVDLRICLIALTKLSLSTHTKTSLSPRRSKILQEKRFETRLKGLNLLLDKVKQESLLVALNNFIRLFKMMQFENWQYNDEKFYTKLANNVQINDLKNSIMNYLLSTEQMECLTTILNIMQGKISNLVVNKFVQQWQSLCLSAQLPIYTQTDFILSLSTRFLFTQLYAINTPVYNLIGVLTPDSKQRIEGELQFRTQDALNFLARLFDAASEILIHEEGPECIKISVNDLTISVSLDHIYRYVFSIKQGGQNTQAAWRHILERADAYVKRYKGDNDTYAYLVESLLTEHLTSAYAIKRIDYLYTHQQWKLICEDEWLLWQSKWEPVRSHIQDKFSIFLNQLRNYQNLQLLFWEGGECQFEHQQLYLQLLIVALPRFLTDQQKEELAYLADLEIFETLKLILNKLEKVEPLEKFNLNIMRVLYKELEQQIEKIKCEWPNFPLSKHGRRILNEYFAEIGSIRWRPSAQLLVNAFASPLNIQAYNYKAWSGFLSSKLFADNYKVFLEHHVELMDLSDRYGFPCIREDFASSKPSILKSICSFLDITFEQLKEGNILAVNELALHVVSGYIVELSIIYDYQLALEKYRECIKLLTNLQTEVTRAEKLLKAVANRRYEEAYGIWSDIFNQIVAHSNDEASFQQYIVSSASMLAFNQTLFTQAILAIPQTPTGHTDYGPLQGFSEYLLQQPKIDLSPLLKAFFEEQLFFAAAHGSDVLVILALHCGINVNAQSSNIKTRSFTALHTAAYFGRDRTVKTLLLQGADVKARSYDDESIPLHSAAVSHNSAVIAQLVAAGSPLEACNKNGFSPFTLAVSSGDHEAVETFLQLGVDANIRDSSLQTPFHRVVNRDLLKNPDKIFRIAVILMRYGANCDAQDHTLSTILHLAVKIDKPELDAFIIFLINAGANTTLPDTNNQTPYELASPRLKKIISETTTMFNEETKRRAAALKSEIERIETENNILTQQMETRASRTIVIQELESYELRTAPTPPLAKLVGKLGMISANVPSKTARPALDRLLEAPPEPSPKSKNPIRQ